MNTGSTSLQRVVATNPARSDAEPHLDRWHAPVHDQRELLIRDCSRLQDQEVTEQRVPQRHLDFTQSGVRKVTRQVGQPRRKVVAECRVRSAKQCTAGYAHIGGAVHRVHLRAPAVQGLVALEGWQVQQQDRCPHSRAGHAKPDSGIVPS